MLNYLCGVVMKILRVFPRLTSMTPLDGIIGLPDLWRPKADEVHISVAFTWDIEYAKHMKKNWEVYYPVVKIGGPAFGDPGGNFEAGKYLEKGCVITSRGCPNNCSFCLVPKREGKIRELPIVEGNIIQDNNLLACSKSHIDKVFQMLSKQKRVDFAGGFESARVTDQIVQKLRGLKLYQLWLAYDHPNAEKPLIRAVDKLRKYFSRDKIRCYVLIGYNDDTIEKAEHRLRRAWEIGTLPFAMLYRDEKNTEHSKDWKQFQRKWTRPAIIKSMDKLLDNNKLKED